MLINRAGEVKISDFGIVRKLEEEEEEEEEEGGWADGHPAGWKGRREEEKEEEEGPRERPRLLGVGEKAQTFVGTVTYMSPERLDGQDYSYAADIWR